LLLVLKSGRLVRTVAKGLAGGVSAPAESDRRATRKAVRLAIHVEDLNFPLDAQGAIVADGYFRGWHLSSRLSENAKSLFFKIPLTDRSRFFSAHLPAAVGSFEATNAALTAGATNSLS
jgi:hypothetical protein